MRFIFFLLLLLFIHNTALSQSLSGYITKLEKEIADAKSNNADPVKIKELEKILEEMKFTQSYLDKGVIPKPKTNTNTFPGASWSGFLSSTREGSTELPLPVSTRNSQIYLFFSEAVPTLHRNFNENEELNFTDDKGTGTLKDHAVITIGTQTSTCDCSGTGASELHEVVVDLFDSTYTIDALAPECTGAGGADGSCGLTFSITIPGEKLTNSNVLSGTRTVTTSTSGINATVTTTWYLVRTIDVELIVKPHDYDTWLPKPGKDEKTVGNTMTVDLLLQGKNGKPLKQKAKSFEILLNYTSREPGVTINFPLSPIKNGTPPDLQLLEQPNAEVENESQKMKIDCNGCTTSSFNIGAFDGGAYSTFTAIAILEDDSRITGHLLVPASTTEITIPKRNGSTIGEYWLKQNGNPGDYEDKDISRGNNKEGDGLTAYEEYRGVISEGVFKRLDPVKKELGVTMQRSLFATFSQGLDWFKAASDVGVVKFYIHEIAADRRLNKNYSTGHIYDQYVLHLINGFLPDNTAGKAFTKTDKPEIPANTTRVVISTANIKQNYLNWSGYAQVNHMQLPWTEKEYLAQTIAHEIGHGVKIPHHGDNSTAPQNETANQGGNPVYHIFSRNGIEITTRPYTVDAGDRICSAHTQASGDLSCIMAYIDVCDWARIEYADGSVGLFQSPLLPIGKNFCISSSGTGINAGIHQVSGTSYQNYFGKATNGNCLSWIQLK